jgi:transcriptional regulator with AAA-type ATPase domain
MPPLREHIDDVFPLTRSFLKQEKKAKIRVSFSVYLAFLGYDWPGNVGEFLSELKKAVFHLGEGRELTLENFSHSDQLTNIIGLVREMKKEEVCGKVLSQLSRSLERQGFRRGEGLQKQLAEVLGYSEGHISKLVRAHIRDGT